MEQPISERTEALLDAIAKVDSKITELQSVSEEVHTIKRILEKQESRQESRWNAFVRALKHFLSLTGEKLP